MASPVADVYFSSGNQVAAGRYVEPDWAPVAGEIKTISHAAGYFGTNGGATLYEINPQYQSWNPLAPTGQPYSRYTWAVIFEFSSVFYNEDTRQLVAYGAGHAAYNITAHFCFDLNELRWKWLDVPIPSDGYGAFADSGGGGVEVLETYYPPAMHDSSWGDWSGDWIGWLHLYGPGPWIRPGIRQVTPGHSRASLINLPASVVGNRKGAMLHAAGCTGETSGSFGVASHLFSYDVGEQRRLLNQYPFGSGASGNEKGQIVDPVTKKVVFFGSTGPTYKTWTIFDVPTESWSQRTAETDTKTTGDHGGNTFHEASRLIIVPCRAIGTTPTSAGTNFIFYAVPVDDVVGVGTFSPAPLTVNVVTGWPLNHLGDNRHIGWEYCPDDECLYCVTGSNNSTKYWKLAPPAGATTTGEYWSGTWTLTEHTFINGGYLITTTSSNFTSPYRRLAWDRKSRSFIWVSNRYVDPVQAFRPEGL